MAFISSTQPFKYIFNPVPEGRRQNTNLFPFLEGADKITPPGLENSICFRPQSFGLPWPTTFPVAIESKYWRDARETAKSLLRQIRHQSHSDPLAQIEPEFTERDLMLIDIASRAPAHMFPASSASQIKVLAKGNIFIFTHDGELRTRYVLWMKVLTREDEFDSRKNHDVRNHPKNLLKEALEEMDILPKDPTMLKREWKNPLFQQWVDECVHENFTGGLLFVLGALEWTKFAIENPPKTKGTFATWSEYMEFRIMDFMAHGIRGMLQISTGIEISESEWLPLANMYNLYMTHFCLTNDLYSYQKEVVDAGGEGFGILNGVAVLEHMLQVSSETARSILHSIVIDVETKLAAVYKAHLESGGLNERQIRHARSMIEGLAGNIFYSSTCARYAHVVPGSRTSC